MFLSQTHLQQYGRQDQGTSLKLDLPSCTNPDQSLSNYCVATALIPACHCCHLRPLHKNVEGEVAIRIERCLHPPCASSRIISQALGLTGVLLPRAPVFYLPAHRVLLTVLRMCQLDQLI